MMKRNNITSVILLVGFILAGQNVYSQKSAGDVEDAVVGQSVAANLARLVFLKLLGTISTEVAGIHILIVRQVVYGTPDGIVLVGNDISWLRIRLRQHHHSAAHHSQKGKSFLHSLQLLRFLFVFWQQR